MGAEPRSPKRAAIVHVEYIGRSSPARNHPGLNGAARDRAPRSREANSRLDEAVELARAIGLSPAYRAIAKLRTRHPGFLFGKGKLEDLDEQLLARKCGLLIVNAELKPIQQRNLERALAIKVIDRTALILEIFGARALSREGTLQVEMAHLAYQKSRLVRSWTHLERQRGGLGFIGGPGERQIEADRRALDEKIAVIAGKLQAIGERRERQRVRRQRSDLPVIALVGYTNVGKSTLFNLLTGAKKEARNQLFATLDPAHRRAFLPKSGEILFLDTVGFVADLPTELIQAFHATLEEVRHADLLLLVHDGSSPEFAAQKRDVEMVLEGIGADHIKRVEIYNKSDRIAMTARADLPPGALLVSAQKGEGVDLMKKKIDAAICADIVERRGGEEPRWVELAYDEGDFRAWLYQKRLVIKEEEFAEGFRLFLSPRRGGFADLRRSFQAASAHDLP